MASPLSTVDQINRRIGSLHERIQVIADRTANMALLGAADESNPTFVELMRDRETYLEEAEKLISEAEVLVGIKRS